jgi:hypothetical protein
VTTVTLTLLGAGIILFLSGVQCKSILQTYQDLLAGKQLELTGPCSPAPSSGGGGSGGSFGGGAGGQFNA